MLGPGYKYEVNRQFRILHKQELYGLYRPPAIDRMMNFWMLQWDGNIARVERQGIDTECFREPLGYLVRDRGDGKVILLSTFSCEAYWSVEQNVPLASTY
jgi:hypothetical protein